MWKIVVPPRLHIFLWLLANIKTLTRDNLVKRRKVEDATCLFCDDLSFFHLFFECCVEALRKCCSEIAGMDLGTL
jgi:hypothetical protein